MRIRKRKVPLPLSLLSPIPLTDPNLFSRSPVMVVQHGGSSGGVGGAGGGVTSFTNEDTSQPSDQTASDLHRLIFSPNYDMGIDGVNDDVSKASITTSIRAGATPTDDDDNNNDNNEFRLSLSNNAGNWYDGDKAIPLKKRRGSSFNHLNEDKNTTNIPISTKVDDNNKPIPASNVRNTGELVTKKGSNNKRGNTILEGSRCSRVNGRGWRCCQPTLVGYSLCEHHLGKGRLRSITIGSSSNSSSNIKSRTPKKKSNNNGDDKKIETKSSSFGNNKKVKLGVVKARSLSSLLGQTNTMSSSGDHATLDQYDNIISNMDHQ